MAFGGLLLLLFTLVFLDSVSIVQAGGHHHQDKSKDEVLRLANFASLFPNGFSNGTATLPPPSSGLKLKALTLGRGTQNYTCNATHPIPNPTGAIATLFDLSPHLPPSATLAYESFPFIPPILLDFDIQTIEKELLGCIGHHFFNALGQATFDLSEAGMGIMVGKKTGDILSPSTEDLLEEIIDGAPGAVDWLSLVKSGGEGSLGEVFRVFTAGGKPTSAGCGGKSEVEVQYAALYWFYG